MFQMLQSISPSTLKIHARARCHVEVPWRPCGVPGLTTVLQLGLILFLVTIFCEHTGAANPGEAPRKSKVCDPFGNSFALGTHFVTICDSFVTDL